jgi:hypothetical protein
MEKCTFPIRETTQGKSMPSYKSPKRLQVLIDPYAALVAAEYLQQAARKETAPTLSGMLAYVAQTIREACHSEVPRVLGAHLTEQTEAHLQELLGGIDSLYEDTMADQQDWSE